MNDNNFTMFFVMMALINFSIGIDNNEKNTKHEQKQLEIDNKLNKILELLDGRK